MSDLEIFIKFFLGLTVVGLLIKLAARIWPKTSGYNVESKLQDLEVKKDEMTKQSEALSERLDAYNKKHGTNIGVVPGGKSNSDH